LSVEILRIGHVFIDRLPVESSAHVATNTYIVGPIARRDLASIDIFADHPYKHICQAGWAAIMCYSISFELQRYGHKSLKKR
jgi:hypothetical protein